MWCMALNGVLNFLILIGLIICIKIPTLIIAILFCIMAI